MGPTPMWLVQPPSERRGRSLLRLRLQYRQDAVHFGFRDVGVVRRGEADPRLARGIDEVDAPILHQPPGSDPVHDGKALAQAGSTSMTEPPMVGSSLRSTLQVLSPDRLAMIQGP